MRPHRRQISGWVQVAGSHLWKHSVFVANSIPTAPAMITRISDARFAQELAVFLRLCPAGELLAAALAVVLDE